MLCLATAVHGEACCLGDSVDGIAEKAGWVLMKLIKSIGLGRATKPSSVACV
jgi:hypothetical protein